MTQRNDYIIFSDTDGRFAVQHIATFIWNNRNTLNRYTFGIRFKTAKEAREWILSRDTTPSCNIEEKD